MNDTPAPRPGNRFAQLLERDTELAAIDMLTRSAAGGDGRLLLIEGPAGIGKTRLVTEARRQAGAMGMRVLGARSSELEREYPFGVVRQLFEAQLVDPAARDRLLQGSAAAARPVLAPLDAAAEPTGDVSFAALHGLYWLCVNLAADGPLLLTLDDLHWCDSPSLRFLSYLVRRLDGLPVLVVGSLRPAEPGADAALIAELSRDPLGTVLRPAPLTADAAGALVEARLGADADPAFAAACHRATGGNPLLLNELLAEMEAENVTPDTADTGVVRDLGPRAVSRAVSARMSRLPGGVTAVARAAAVLGEGAEPAHVAALAGVTERQAADAVAELTRVEVLRPELPVGFVHPLVRAAVYFDLPPGEREDLHARAARLLGDSGAAPERVAAHLLEVRPRGDRAVVEALTHAAAVALGRGGEEGAIAYLTRALAEPPDPANRPLVQARLGIAQSLRNGPAAIENLTAAYRALPDPVERARLAVLLVAILLFADRIREAVALAREAEAALPPDEDDLRYQLAAHRLGAAFWDRTVQPFDDPELRGYREDTPDTVGGRMLAGVAAYTALMAGRPREECIALGRGSVADGVLIEMANASMPYCGGLVALVLADDDEALRVSERSVAKGYNNGSLFEGGGACLFHGFTSLNRGDLAEAGRMLEDAHRRVIEWGSGDVLVISAAYEIDAALERGDLDAAWASHAAALPYSVKLANGTNASWWYASLMRLLLAAGRPEEVLAVSRDAEARFAGLVTNPAVLPWRTLRAEALDRLGRGDEGIPLVEQELDVARAFGAPGTVGRTLRVLGELRRERGIDALREAIDVLEGSPARLELAKALTALGTTLRLSRHPTEAREPLRRALELAAECEAHTLVERVRHELYATGMRPRSEALTGVGALTASERRVAGLAAEGSSNKDIAQSLYVTPKTVEVHLSNAYRKLGIRSRRELAGALAAAG